MSFSIDWNNLPSNKFKKSSGKKDGKDLKPLNFVKFTDDSSHILRPVGKAHGFFRFYYKPAKRYIIANVKIDKDGQVTESNVEELKELLGCDPEQRFAMNVIDRSDKVIKILSGPMQMLNDFGDVAKSLNIVPGGMNGGDWKITSTGAGKSRRYRCNYLGQSPFTDEELTRIKNPDKSKNEWYILEDIYKPTDMKYVNKLVGKDDVSPAAANVETEDLSTATTTEDIDF